MAEAKADDPFEYAPVRLDRSNIAPVCELPFDTPRQIEEEGLDFTCCRDAREGSIRRYQIWLPFCSPSESEVSRAGSFQLAQRTLATVAPTV